MTTPVTLASGPTRDYGCGLSVVRRDGETVLSHGGAVSGFQAYSALIPRTRSALVILTNLEPSYPALARPSFRALCSRTTRGPMCRKWTNPTPGTPLSTSSTRCSRATSIATVWVRSSPHT